MKDRKSKYPGQIKLIPVDEANGIYQIQLWDEATQIGTPLTAENLLSEETETRIKEITGDLNDAGLPNNLGDMTVDEALLMHTDLLRGVWDEEDGLPSKFPNTGGVMAGDIDMGIYYTIRNLMYPEYPGDAASMEYVEDMTANLANQSELDEVARDVSAAIQTANYADGTANNALSYAMSMSGEVQVAKESAEAALSAANSANSKVSNLENGISELDSKVGGAPVWYGTCSTASSTAAKVVTLSGFTLKTGAIIAVKFTNTNTASSPTLNVNSTGAKAIKKYGTTAPETYFWYAGAVVLFLYDGTNFLIENGTTATTTYYGLTKLSSSTSSTSTTLAATPSAVKSAYDRAGKALPTHYTLTITPSDWADHSTKGYVYYTSDTFFLPSTSSLTYEIGDFVFTPQIPVYPDADAVGLMAAWHCVSCITFEYSNSVYRLAVRALNTKPSDTFVIDCVRLKTV